MSINSLLACLEISPTCAAAAHAHLDNPGKHRADSSNPHEGEHLFPNVGLDVEFVNAGKRHLQNHKDGGAENGCDGHEDRIQKGEEPDNEGYPSTVDRKDRDKDEDEGEAGACEEQSEHPL